jgi:hypothetical protein
MKIFCISIYNKNFNQFKKMKFIPVGVGNSKFNNNWITDKGFVNISKKNSNFGEYTFHYKLWKNNLINKNYNNWIAFCTYRRFWTTKQFDNISNFETLNKIIIKKPNPSWKKYDVVLGKPLIFKKIKNIKMLKRNLVEVLKKPKVLINKTTLKDQFNIFHGSYFLEKSLSFLSKENKCKFEDFLNGYELYPYNMFMCKNATILNQFYNEIFPWLFKCEENFKKKNLDGYDKKRIYGFLAERYMPFWFIKNFKVKTSPISFFDTTLLKT